MFLTKRKGFTLVELLIVISIIGVLAGLILIGLRAVRLKAIDVQRKSDMSALNRMIISYTSENNEKYPECGTYGWELLNGSCVADKLINNGLPTTMPSGSEISVYSDGSNFGAKVQLQSSNNAVYAIDGNGGEGGTVATTADIGTPVWKDSPGVVTVAFLDRSLGKVLVIFSNAYDDNGYTRYIVRYKRVGDSNWIEELSNPTNYKPVNIINFVAGSQYVFQVQAYDMANNASTILTRTIDFSSVDQTLPVWVNNNRMPIVTTNNDFRVDVFPSDNSGQGALYAQYGLMSDRTTKWKYLADPVGNNSPMQSGSARGIGYRASGGLYGMYIYAVDSAGNRAPSAQMQSDLPVGPKTGDVIYPIWGPNKSITPVESGAQYKFQWSAAGDDYKVHHYIITVKDLVTSQDLLLNTSYTGLISDAMTISNLNKSNGYIVTIKAYDVAGNVDPGVGNSKIFPLRDYAHP